MAEAGSHEGERIRAAELIATLCLATDLGMGFPFEHGLHSTLVAMRLAERLRLDPAGASQTYYACLLTYSGCTADAEEAAEIFAGDLQTHFQPFMFGSPRELLGGLMRAIPDPEDPAPARALQIARRMPRAARANRRHLRALCEVGEMLAARLGLARPMQAIFAHLTERWDGKGALRRAEGEEIPVPLRVTHVARDAAFQRLLGGEEFAVEMIRERAGHAFDPAVADCLVEEMLMLDLEGSAWHDVLAAEPPPHLTLAGNEIERALAAMGDFADLISPYFVGHSSGVAELASGAAERSGLGPAEATLVRRAGLVHDLGRVGVHPRIWNKRGALSADEWEQVRLHPYHSERVLSCSPVLAGLAGPASSNHERLDGSGYHRGSPAPALDHAARILAAADAYHAMTEPRPHRPPLPLDRAADTLASEASAGRLDPDAVAAVIEQKGQEIPPIERPASLTDREAQVTALLARGMQTKQIARALGISVKTADRHIQNAYAKIGVSTRAAAALFAMEHGFLAWGEFPIAGAAARS